MTEPTFETPFEAQLKAYLVYHRDVARRQAHQIRSLTVQLLCCAGVSVGLPLLVFALTHSLGWSLASLVGWMGVCLLRVLMAFEDGPSAEEELHQMVDKLRLVPLWIEQLQQKPLETPEGPVFLHGWTLLDQQVLEVVRGLSIRTLWQDGTGAQWVVEHHGLPGGGSSVGSSGRSKTTVLPLEPRAHALPGQDPSWST